MMKYKVDDRVVLKFSKYTLKNAIKDANNLPDRVATISKVHSYYYEFKELKWAWPEHGIDGLAEEILDPVKSRWHILDLRKE